jgi:hypothetical protein
MRKLVTLLTILTFAFGCTNKEKNFPDTQDVLAPGYSSFENFFPIKTLDLSTKGISDKIHIMYVCFDPDIDSRETFPDQDYIDEFTFKIMDDGIYQPTFDKKALTIGENYKKYFVEGKRKYESLKMTNKDVTKFIDLAEKPEWWQDDQTPTNSKGENMTFICQIDIYEVFNDDCRLYVFYDKTDRIVKYIYQRT